MPWIDELPNVDQELVAQRNAIAEKQRRADELMHQVERLRIEVMRESSRLEERAKQRWTFNEIDLAKFRAGH
nr:stable inheritance protein KleA [Pseudomonas alloputida]